MEVREPEQDRVLQHDCSTTAGRNGRREGLEVRARVRARVRDEGEERFERRRVLDDTKVGETSLQARAEQCTGRAQDSGHAYGQWMHMNSGHAQDSSHARTRAWANGPRMFAVSVKTETSAAQMCNPIVTTCGGGGENQRPA